MQWLSVWEITLGNVDRSGLVFALLLVCALALVSTLGAQRVHDLRKLDPVRVKARQLTLWLTSAEPRRSAGKAIEPAACGRVSASPGHAGSTWADCLRALQEPGQPLSGLVNPLQAHGLAVSGRCERQQFATLGSIVIERVTRDPSPGSSSLTRATLSDKQTLDEVLLLHVAVCGPGFSTLDAAEVRF